MYVRLKHTLSTLTLEMLAQAPRHRPMAWLLAYARLAPDGNGVGLAELRKEAARQGPAGPRSLRRLEALGLLQRETGRIRLAPEYMPHREYLIRQVRRLSSALRDLDWEKEGGTPSLLRRGIALFNAGLFFECHEYLEDIWRATRGHDRDFYHGIIQVAAAFYHFEKGNQHGARTLLAKALSKLEGYRPRHLGADVDRLAADLQPWRRRFSTRTPGDTLNPGEFPTIVLRGTI